jgi:RHS repeat-associated protein
MVSTGATSKTLVFDTTSTSLADLGWRREEMEFTANSPNTNLDFLSKIPGFTGPVIDNVRVYPILQKDNAWTVEVKVGEVKENINFGLARNKDYTGEHDLQIASIDAEQLTVDPQLLTVEGPVTATIKNAGVDPLNKPFTFAFFEDRNYDKVYDSNLDTLLSTVEVDKSIAGGASLSVTADLSAFMAFAHAPIWGVVDVDNVVVETDETNNLNFSESDCLVDAPPKPQLLKEIFSFGGGAFPQDHIYRVDLSTGSTTDLGFSGIGFPTNLAMTADRTLYYMNPHEPHALYKATLDAGNTTLVGPGTLVANLPTAGLGAIDGLTAGPDGSLYMTGYGKSEIYRYDLTTNIFTTEVILQNGGTTGGEFRSDLAFDPKTGNLVGLGIEPGTSDRKLFEIPLSIVTNGIPDLYSWSYYGGSTSAWASKALNTSSELGGNPDGIAFDPTNGDLYMTGDGTGIYSYHRDTAVRESLITSTGDGSLNGLGFDLAFQTVSQSADDESQVAAPDLIASYLRSTDVGGQTSATVRIGNAGSIFVAAGVNVAFYEGDPRTGGRLLGVSQTSKRLEIGDFEDVTLTVASPPLSTVWVVADDDGTGVGKVRECDEVNNFYSLLGPGQGEIRGTVWSDRNGDGSFNQTGDGSENGLPGVTVYLDVNNNRRLDAGEPSRITAQDNPRTADTNEDGQYRFTNLSYGSYTVRELVPSGYQQTVPGGDGGAAVFLTAASALQEVNLGNGSIPVITSAPVRSVYAGTNYSYAVQTNDAGGGGLTYQLLEAPQGMGISSAGLVTWVPGALGTVPVSLEVRNPSGAKAIQAFQLAVEADLDAPVISLRPSGTVFKPGETLTLNLSAIDNVAVTDLRLTLNGNPLSLIPNLPNQPNQASVVLNQLGSYTIQATAADFTGNVGTSSVQVRVPDPADKTPPVISLNLTSFDPTKPLTQLTNLVGSISGDPDSWRVELAPINLVDAANPAAPDPDYVTIGSGTGNTLNATLATIDPSLFRNDNYLLRVISQDFSGNLDVKSTVVGLFSEEKPADFKLDFTDLSIPLTGLPIQVGRSYSSLNAQVSGDFGYGWNLSFQDAQIQESAPDGRNLGDDDLFFGNGLTVGTRITLTNPEGRRVGFTFDPKFVTSIGGFLSLAGIGGNLYRPYFRPDPGVYDSLEVVPDPSIYDNLTAFDVVSDLIQIRGDNSAATPGFIPFIFNPSTYFLRTKAGDTYQYNQNAGLIDITDRNGNKLSYSDTGIVSSTGKSINFTRDGEGRITEIRDPEGKVIKYSYNALGELVGVTDRTGNTTTMEYKSSRPHYLSKVVDPLGRTASRTEYDDQGRVKRILDAEGNALDLSYDTNARVQVVKDPLGHTITLISDERGNVIEQVDANGGITKRTYDTNNNVLTNTDPEGNTTTYSYDTRGNKLSETNPEGEKRTFEYSPTNKMLKETDALGFSTTYTYDARDNLLSRTDANGKTTTYAYDARGQMTSITDANGKVSTFSYDLFGNLVTLTDPTGGVTSFTYDAKGQVKSMTDPLGAITNYLYDDQGRLIEKADPEGSSCGCARGITKTEYNSAGEKVAEIDALGRRTEYRYNNRGLLIETILPDDTPETKDDNPRLRIDYDAADRKISSSDELGRLTFYVYDKQGQLIETIYPDATPATSDDNPRTRKEYDMAGRVVAEVDELGNRSTMAYDKAGRLIAMTNALGQTTTHSYDDAGRKVSMTDALGRITRYSYDGMDRLVSTTYANDTRSSNTYDALGRVIQETDLAGLSTNYEYDALGRLTAVVDPLNQRTEYTYDLVGNLIAQKDANGNVTSFTYDSLRRRVDMVLPEGQLKKTIHDKIGNLIRSTDANGVTTTYTYDARNWLIEKAFSDGTPTETFTYTATGQLKTVTDNRGTTEYAYDERDRLLSRSEPDGRTITYTYDKAGNIRTLSVPSGTTSYTYDALNRLDTVTDPDGGVTDYNYDAVGNLKTTTFANGVVESRDYDPLNRLLYLENRGVAGVLSSYHYSLDAMGNRLKVEEQDGRTVNYSYDKLYRLTKEQIVDPSNGNRTVSFEYDPVGNRLKRIDSLAGTTTYSYDNNDRLLAEVLAGQTITYSYDNNGSLTAKAANGQIEAEYRWNAKGELIGATVRDNGSTNTVSFEYDHQGMRVAATVNGQETRFLLDTTQQRYAQVIEEYLANGTLSRSYTYGRDLLSQDDTTTRSYYQVDGLGSTRQLTDANGNMTLSYDYQAFGELLQKVGSGDNRYLFAGEQFDESVDLTYLRARYYDMATGRFTSVDPFEGALSDPVSTHDYLYAGSNPVLRIDPTGRFFLVSYAIDAATFIWNHKSKIAFGLTVLSGFGVAACAISAPLTLKRDESDEELKWPEWLRSKDQYEYHSLAEVGVTFMGKTHQLKLQSPPSDLIYKKITSHSWTLSGWLSCTAWYRYGRRGTHIP